MCFPRKGCGCRDRDALGMDACLPCSNHACTELRAREEGEGGTEESGTGTNVDASTRTLAQGSVGSTPFSLSSVGGYLTDRGAYVGRRELGAVVPLLGAWRIGGSISRGALENFVPGKW